MLSDSVLSLLTPPGTPGTSALLTISVPGYAPASANFTYVLDGTDVAPCTGTDSDSDGLPDAWEAQFGLSSLDPSDALADVDGDGRTALQECQTGTHPRGLYTRYLAEGATGAFFTTRVAISNPNATTARALLRFQTGDHRTVPFFAIVPAMARRTVDLEAIPGLESADVSTVVESDVEIVVDRTMQWDRSSRFGAHAETSRPAPAVRWYLAEGATHGTFDLFYLLQNPGLSGTAQVHVRFICGSGDPIERDYAILPNSRFTLQVDAIAGLEAADVSADITSSVPIIVERAMYSSAAGAFAAGHDSAGVTAPSSQWFLAEGATGSYFDLFLLFANTSSSDAEVDVTYLLPSGATVVKHHTIPANRRVTINVAPEDPLVADAAVSTKVRSTNNVPIIVERSMWWPHGQPVVRGAQLAGGDSTGTKWTVADGELGRRPQNAQTYLLVANTSASAASLRVTFILEGGQPVTRDYAVRPRAVSTSREPFEFGDANDRRNAIRRHR